MPPSAEELRELQKKAVQSVENPPDAEVRASRAFDGEAAGLSKRDYVPLAVAVFVDLCLFLVSMAQRPANRLDGLVPKMSDAERGPVIEILSRFNDIHRDQQIRENFELFRHVVFDMNGDYYVAVPLDAPPRMNPAEREELRVEAQLLANLFASFEREKIFKRTLLPTTGSIQKRLGRQGSKFAGSESFRVYKFAQGAWSDIILGAVMGAARRAEAEEDDVRNTREPDLPRPAARVLPDAPVPKPETPAPNFERHAASPAPTLSIDPQHAMRFGPYAETYRPDPASPPYYAPPRTRRPPAAQPEADATVKAANSNTARTAPIVPPPSRNRPRPSSRCRERNTPRRPTTTRILNQFAIRRWPASRCSARRRLSLCPSAKPPFPDSLKVALAGADQNWANIVRRRQEADVIDACPCESRPRPAMNRRRASPKTSFLPRTGPLFAASHHRLPNEKGFDRKRDNWLRHKSTRAATLA